jgi:small GTP-binding protein
MSSTLEKLNILLNNYFEAVSFIESALVFDRHGLLLTKKSRGKLSGLFEKDAKDIKESEIYGAITGIVDKTLNRITNEYEIGSFGTGSFETEDHRLVFTEAGPQAILLSVFRYEVELNGVLPYCFLIAEKISNIVGDRPVQLAVPHLELGFELGISPASIIKTPIQYTDDHVVKRTEMRFKLIVLGDSSVGKTSLINQFVTKKFYTDYRPTLGISITSQVYSLQGFDETTINLMLWDLAGQKFFKRVRKHYYQAANAAFIVFDVTRQDTFDNIKIWFEDLKESLEDKTPPIVIIGNKIDLEKERVISLDAAQQLAKDLHCSYMETSAKTGENVRDAFSLIGIGLFFKMSDPTF